jgi:NAD(P)-dependent dehydrogenase (short-subunit alcohol dehydrogenase family)
MDAAPFGVRVIAIAPGPVETEIFGRLAGNDQGVKNSIAFLNIMKRVAAPEGITNSVVFVGSDKAAFMTGQSFSVDGGPRHAVSRAACSLHPILAQIV